MNGPVIGCRDIVGEIEETTTAVESMREQAEALVALGRADRSVRRHRGELLLAVLGFEPAPSGL
jgi:hypothetical protein